MAKNNPAAATEAAPAVTPPTPEELAEQAKEQELRDLRAQVALLTAKLEVAEAPRPADQLAVPSLDEAARSVVGIERKLETHNAVRVDH